MEDIEIPPLILVDVAFPLWTFLLKAHGDAILQDNKRYFNYRNIPARLVTEEALGRLKIKCWALFRKCPSNKETAKLCGLACVVLHNLCIKRGYLVPRKIDWTSDHASNRFFSPGEVMDVLALGSMDQKNFKVNFKSLKSIHC